MAKRLIGNCYIDAQRLPRIVLSLGKNTFEIIPEKIMTNDKKIICGLYDVDDSIEVKREINTFLKDMRSLDPLIIFKNDRRELIGFLKGVRLKAYSFFGSVVVFEEKKLKIMLKRQAIHLILKTKKYYDRLTYMLTRMSK